MNKIFLLSALIPLLLFPLSARAADPVYLALKANGADIKGESSQSTLGRKDTIECLTFESAVATSREAGTGMATGRRQYQPLLIRKRIDKSSPLLMRALTNNEVITGEFKFFRPNPAGDGTTEQFYTVSIKGARIASIRLISPDTTDPKSASQPPMEEITFVFQTITWVYNNGGISHTDTWNSLR